MFIKRDSAKSDYIYLPVSLFVSNLLSVLQNKNEFLESLCSRRTIFTKNYSDLNVIAMKIKNKVSYELQEL